MTVKRRIVTIVVVFFAVLALLAGVVSVVVNSGIVQHLIVSRVNALLPGTVTFNTLHIALLSGRVELSDVAVADSSGKQLAGFKRLTVVVSLPQLLRRTLVVESAALEHPWAVLDIDSGGRLTLPGAFVSGSPSDSAAVEPDSNSKPFQMNIHDFRLVDGTVSFAAQKEQISLQANGLTIVADGESAARSGHLSLRLASAVGEMGGTHLDLRDIVLMARVRDLNVDTISLRMKSGASVVSLDGKVMSPADSPVVNMRIAADIALADLRTITGQKEKLDGTADLRMHLRGSVANPDLDLGIVYHGGRVIGYPVDSLGCMLSLADRVLTIGALHLATRDGSAGVTGKIDARAMFPGGFFKKTASVQTLGYVLAITGNRIPLKNLAPGLSGTAAVSMMLNGNGVDPDSLTADVMASVQVAALRLKAASPPLDAAVACTASVRLGTAFVRGLTGKTGSASLALSGKYRISSGEMDATLSAAVPELDTLLAFAGIDSVSGGATLSARVNGRPGNLDAAIDVDADSVIFRNVRAGKVVLAAVLDRDGTAQVKRLDIKNGTSQAQLRGTAKIIEKGVALPFERMNFDAALVANRLSFEDFIDSVAGSVAIDAAVRGSAGDLHGHVRLSAENLAAAGQKVARVNLDAELDGQRAIVQPLTILLAPGQQLTATGWASLNDSFNLALSVPEVRLTTIGPLAKIDSLDGALSVDLQAQGSYTRPEARGVVAIRNIRMGSTVLDDIGLNLELHDRQVEVRGKAGGDLRAGFNLETHKFVAGLTLSKLPLAPYLALAGKDFDGSITAEVKVAGNADSVSVITGTLHITSLLLGYQKVRIIETHELRATLGNNRYTIPDFSIMLAGEGALTGHAGGLLEGPHDAALRGTIPLTIARHFAPDLGDIGGNIDLDAFFRGTADSADLRADIRLRDISMTIPGLSQRLHSLNGHILATPEALKIESLRGKVDDGEFSLNGGMKLDELAPSGMQADITLNAVPVGIPEMLDMVLDARLHLSGTPDSAQATGTVTILDGIYYQDVVINPLAEVGKRKRKVAAPPPDMTLPYLRNLRFDVGVRSRSPLRVDDNLAQLTITPDLQLGGALAAPSLYGRADVEQGTITYLKRIFTVERGVVDFVNPYAVEPRVDIKGTIPVQGRTVQIALSGPPDDLAFALSSDDPLLGDQDILSMLVLGRTTAELQREIRSGDVVQSNQQMIASLVASTFGDDIKKVAGLDVLEVEAGSDTSDNADRIAVTVGKQLTRRLGTKYTVESQSGQIIQRATAEYRILQNLLISGFQDTKGIHGGELRYKWERR